MMLVPAIIWIWIALPMFPIVAGWLVFRKSTDRRAEPTIVLLLATISYAWLLVGLILPSAIGADYSTRRYVTILVHLVVMVGLSLWALRRGPNIKRPEWMASLATASVWFYALAVSSVV